LEKNDVFEELQNIIGEAAAKRFIEHYSGSNLYIPRGIVIEQQNQKIREEFKNGASYRELALKYEFTETHIRNIIHRK
jgi:Mor family transcriptional regulator